MMCAGETTTPPLLPEKWEPREFYRFTKISDIAPLASDSGGDQTNDHAND
jgi:hypothetical protein